MLSKRWLLASCLVLLAGTLRGQSGPDNDPVGLHGLAGVGSVNPFNSQLTIPIAAGPSYPIGPNLRFQAVLTYNSRAWELGHPSTQSPDFTYTPIAGNPALGIGWGFTLGAVKLCSGTSTYCYFGPDGGQHMFDEGDAARGAIFFKSSDGARLSLKNNGTSGFEMWDEGGNHYVFTWHVSGYDDATNPINFTHDFGRGRDGWYLTSLTDPFGNLISVTYYTNTSSDSNSPCWTYQGTPNSNGAMQCPSYSAAPNSWIPSKITVPGGYSSSHTQDIKVDLDSSNMIHQFEFPVSGSTAIWTIDYVTQSYSNASSGTINLETITDIKLPSGLGGNPQYSFSYFPSTCPTTGLLKEIVLPGRATIDYKYRKQFVYHTRVGRFAPGCQPIVPPSGQPVTGAPLDDCTSLPSGGLGPPGPCNNSNQEAYLDTFTMGVGRQTVTVSTVASVTDYYQYTFPYGEFGTGPSPANCDALGRCGAESLTVVVSPEVDLNGQAAGHGRRASRAILFTNASDGAGGTEGAPIEERIFDHDVSVQGTITGTACGGSTEQPFCPDKAVRVTQNTFEYGDDVNTTSLNRRLKSQTVYYHATDTKSEVCTNCPKHTVSLSNSTGRSWDAHDGTGNGRHYNIETHTGNLGNDSRATITTWTPQINSSTYLPDVFNHYVDPGKDQYFEFDPANGFQKGTFVWDSYSQRVWLNCKYKDSAGDVSQEFTKTFASSSAPAYNYCSSTYPSSPPSSVGTDQDSFGMTYTYQNGELLTASWLNGTTPLNWHSVYLTRDASTGWVTSSADTAGLSTSYAYDSIGRTTSITPPGETALILSYPSMTQALVQRNALQPNEKLDYDSLGRLIRDRRLMPAGQYSKRFFIYDAAGTPYFSSEWVTESTSETIAADLSTWCSFSGSSFATKRPSAVPGTYQLCFDPFGRSQHIVGANFSSITIADRTDQTHGTSWYSDTKEVVVAACVNGLMGFVQCGPSGIDTTTTHVKDAFGRLTSATEPTGDTTSYAYDGNGNLGYVTQGAQTRTFAYDPFGFLRSETTPEKGMVTYDSYGSLGNLRQATEPGSLVTLRCYDAAGRLSDVHSNENGQTPACGAPGQGRLYAAYTYDQNPSGSNYSLGKLTQRQRLNHLYFQGLSGPPLYYQAPTVTESFTYGGVGGRVSQRTVLVGSGVSNTPANAGENISVADSWTYNTLGLVATYTHPGSITETPTYDGAFPTSEMAGSQSVFSSVGYSPAGGLASWTAGNGVVTTITQDASLLPRPASIATTGASTNFSSGPYAYDGVSNILSIGSDTFGYDSRSRLTSASYAGLGSQALAYDRYGNLTQKGTTNFVVSTSTNQITTAGGVSVAYDVRGNQTGYGSSEVLGYDGLNRQSSEVSSGVEWDYLYDGSGERIVRIPGGNSVLQREMARYIVQARGELPSGTNCPQGGHSRYFTDVSCADPDVHWIDKFYEDGITTGCGTQLFCPGATVSRALMAVYFVTARGEQPATGCTSPTRFADVPCSYQTWGYIERLAQDGIVGAPGCGVTTQCLYYPANATSEAQALAVLQFSWPAYLAVPRGSIYTLRDPGGRVVTELSSAAGGGSFYPTATTVGRDNLFLGSLMVASDASSSWNWYHADHLGSPRIVTNSSKTTVEAWKYWPYGDEATTAASGQRLRFATMERDTEDNHYYDHARTEDFNLGRFLTPDLLFGSPSEPQSWNRYAYVLGNPMLLVDPLGLLDRGYSEWITVTGLFSCDPALGDICEQIPVGGLISGYYDPWRRGPSMPRAAPAPNVAKSYAGRFGCSLTATEVMAAITEDFSTFGNFAGNFSTFGGVGPTADAFVTFGGGPVTSGASIPISETTTVGPGFAIINTSVTVRSVSATGFTFDTVAGHVLYPASIRFTAADFGPGRIGFSIVVHGDFANLFYGGLYYVGGQNLEDKIWSNFMNGVHTMCGS